MQGFIVESEKGHVKVGNEQFVVEIPSGTQGSVIQVYVCFTEEEMSAFDKLKWGGAVNGTFNLYREDTSAVDDQSEVQLTLNGKFVIYYGLGIVVFYKVQQDYLFLVKENGEMVAETITYEEAEEVLEDFKKDNPTATFEIVKDDKPRL